MAQQIKPSFETFARIKVVGVGGAGGNALMRMISSRIQGVEFVAINTDFQDLHKSGAPTKLQIGKNLSRGLGAGMDPDVGRQAATDAKEEILEALKGADMVFITAGLGGGTGTGAGPVVAEIAHDIGALTVAIVTKPFAFEGAQRTRIAEEGWRNLSDKVDAIITIPNDRLLSIIDRKTPIMEAFAIVDDVLRQGVQGISDLSMAEINEAAKIITENIDPNAKVIFGAVENDKLKKGEIQITVIATGFTEREPMAQKPILPLGISSGPSLFDELSNPKPMNIGSKINGSSFEKLSNEPQKKEVVDQSVEDDEMFDIPAFIRKKMK